METTDQEKSDNRPNPRWRRVLNGLFFGAMFGSVLAVAMVAFYLGPSCYVDDRPAAFGGTQSSWAIFISTIWGAVGAGLGAVFGAIVSLPNKLKWRFLTAGIVVVVVAALLFVLNTTSFF